MIERFNEPIQLTNKLESSQRGGRCDRHKNNLKLFFNEKYEPVASPTT